MPDLDRVASDWIASSAGSTTAQKCAVRPGDVFSSSERSRVCGGLVPGKVEQRPGVCAVRVGRVAGERGRAGRQVIAGAVVNGGIGQAWRAELDSGARRTRSSRASRP